MKRSNTTRSPPPPSQYGFIFLDDIDFEVTVGPLYYFSKIKKKRLRWSLSIELKEDDLLFRFSLWPWYWREQQHHHRSVHSLGINFSPKFVFKNEKSSTIGGYFSVETTTWTVTMPNNPYGRSIHSSLHIRWGEKQEWIRSITLLADTQIGNKNVRFFKIFFHGFNQPTVKKEVFVLRRISRLDDVRGTEPTSSTSFMLQKFKIVDFFLLKKITELVTCWTILSDNRPILHHIHSLRPRTMNDAIILNSAIPKLIFSIFQNVDLSNYVWFLKIYNYIIQTTTSRGLCHIAKDRFFRSALPDQKCGRTLLWNPLFYLFFLNN